MHFVDNRRSDRDIQEDLFQIGTIGLMKAIDKFDLTFEVKFSTYAVPMIAGEIKRFLRDDGPVKVSRELKMLATKINIEKKENPNITINELLAGEKAETKTVEEIAERLGNQETALRQGDGLYAQESFCTKQAHVCFFG